MRTVREAILPSGFGIELDAEGAATLSLELSDLARELERKGLLIVRDTEMTWDQCEKFCALFGSAVTYEDETIGGGYNILVDLSGQSDEGEVIRGRGALPIHTDGVLFDNRVDVVLLYSLESQSSHSDTSATIVTDQGAALRAAPPELVSPLRQRGVEYLVEERSYFSVQPDGWYPSRSWRHLGDQEYARVALPFLDDSPPAWRTKIRGWTEDESREYFTAMQEHLLSEEFTYLHKWEVGDLVLVDNRVALHGRQKVTGKRRILNGQINMEGWAVGQLVSPAPAPD